MVETSISLKALCSFCGEGDLLATSDPDAVIISCSFCEEYQVVIPWKDKQN